MNILVFDKKLDKAKLLSPYLTVSEFNCKCYRKLCTRTFVLDSTVKSFTKTRIKWGKPLVVNSAFRCQLHNKKIGGIVNSFHLMGGAMDLRPLGDFTQEDLDLLESIAGLYFDVVLRYDGFIHCHNRGDKPFTITGEQ